MVVPAVSLKAEVTEMTKIVFRSHFLDVCHIVCVKKLKVKGRIDLSESLTGLGSNMPVEIETDIN